MAKTPEINLRYDTSQVGDVVHSILDEATFQTLRGTGWVLMDGRDVTGSAYHTLTTNTTVPDARGIFLRGKNNGRVDGNEDPGGERALGNFQGHATAAPTVPFAAASAGAHTHPNYGAASGSGSYINTFYGAPNSGTVNSVGSAGAHTHSVTGGDAETRVKNITVNIFVRIN